MSMAIRPGGPAIGLPEGVHLAPLGRRIAAFAIDALVPYLLIVLGGIVLASGGPGGLALVLYLLPLAWAVLLWWMYANRAAGPGMRLLNLQVVGMRDGRPIGWSRALLRALVLTVCAAFVVPAAILLVLMLRQLRRQGWHDLAVDSVVIEERQLAPKRTADAAADPVAAPIPGTAAATPTATPAESVDLVEEEPAPDQPITDEPITDEPADAVSPADAEPLRARRATTDEEPAPPSDEDDDTGVDQIAAPVATGPAWYATLGDGRELQLTGLTLLGRNPVPRSGEEGAELIKIVDEARTVSKTHLSLDVDDSGVLVTDRGSTNGSAITDPHGVYQLLAADQPVRLAADGYQISFGSHHLRITQR